ncbi:MAG: metal ABC transporter ATP-binding protein [Armatimonadota bacterium]|nr:metal ABC transporter ATP-binding protein [Armatimonadota bacterium]MDR7518161.1 metal ABC transporter ATP-binding protein [Armatimonadota bacterium]MDR7550578.1 metal ABC transporter ATP-binding protein [Armatimonadota bacterium]
MRTSVSSPKASAVASDAPLVALEHVCFRYGGELVLDQVSLQIRRGDFLGIIGPNGAGKTTLLRIMLGLARSECGHVRLFGVDVRDFPEWHRIGYVPQKAVTFESRFPASVFEVVQSGRCGLAGLGRRFDARDREAALEALETVGMAASRDRLIGQLSAGQQQRVFIARALASRPDLLVLDEPTVGVDPDAQEQFYSLLRRLNREMGTTLVLVSHDLAAIAKEVTQLACLNRTLTYHGSPEEAIQSGAIAQMYRAESWMVAHRH